MEIHVSSDGSYGSVWTYLNRWTLDLGHLTLDTWPSEVLYPLPLPSGSLMMTNGGTWIPVEVITLESGVTLAHRQRTERPPLERSEGVCPRGCGEGQRGYTKDSFQLWACAAQHGGPGSPQAGNQLKTTPGVECVHPHLTQGGDLSDTPLPDAMKCHEKHKSSFQLEDLGVHDLHQPRNGLRGDRSARLESPLGFSFMGIAGSWLTRSELDLWLNWLVPVSEF